MKTRSLSVTNETIKIAQKEKLYLTMVNVMADGIHS